MLVSQAILLENTQSFFKGSLMLLLTREQGKIFCSLHQYPVTAPPAIIEVDLVREKRGFYTAHTCTLEETFPSIRSHQGARNTFLLLADLVKRTLPLEVSLPELWDLFFALLPCLHLFEDSSTAHFLLAYSLSTLQGMDLSWLHNGKAPLDEASKKALVSLPKMDMSSLFSFKCPPQALQYLLEELESMQSLKK